MAWYRCGGGGSESPKLNASAGYKATKDGMAILESRYLCRISTQYDFYRPLTTEGNLPTYDGTKPFKMHLRAKATVRDTSIRSLMGSDTGNNYHLAGLLLWATNDSSNDELGFRYAISNNSWFKINVKKTQVSVPANVWFTIDAGWDGTNAFLNYSDENGQTYSTTSASASSMYKESTDRMVIGNYGATDYPASGVIFDLFDCYWEENGVILWGLKS